MMSDVTREAVVQSQRALLGGPRSFTYSRRYLGSSQLRVRQAIAKAYLWMKSSCHHSQPTSCGIVALKICEAFSRDRLWSRASSLCSERLFMLVGWEREWASTKNSKSRIRRHFLLTFFDDPCVVKQCIQLFICPVFLLPSCRCPIHMLFML